MKFIVLVILDAVCGKINMVSANKKREVIGLQWPDVDSLLQKKNIEQTQEMSQGENKISREMWF